MRSIISFISFVFTVWKISLLMVVFAGSPAAATTIDAALEDIKTTYDFEPSGLSFDEQARRAPALSALWGRFSRNKDIYHHALRIALGAKDGRELMFCDGGMLLLAHISSPEDEALGLKSLERCSLSEIQHTPYFYTMHMLAMRESDTLNFQFRMLEKPKYSVFIVPHFLTLGQDYAFLYPLLVQDESRYVTRLIQRLEIEEDPTAQKTLVRALWYAATPESEVALRIFLKSSRGEKSARNEAEKLLARTRKERQWKKLDPTLQQVLSNLSLTKELPEAELRSRRRVRMRSISDEALHDLEGYTTLIYRTFGGT